MTPKQEKQLQDILHKLNETKTEWETIVHVDKEIEEQINNLFLVCGKRDPAINAYHICGQCNGCTVSTPDNSDEEKPGSWCYNSYPDKDCSYCKRSSSCESYGGMCSCNCHIVDYKKQIRHELLNELIGWHEDQKIVAPLPKFERGYTEGHRESIDKLKELLKE